jgi:hypothetical protein
VDAVLSVASVAVEAVSVDAVLSVASVAVDGVSVDAVLSVASVAVDAVSVDTVVEVVEVVAAEVVVLHCVATAALEMVGAHEFSRKLEAPVKGTPLC